MKKVISIVVLLIVSGVFFNCQEQVQNAFLISDSQVGKLKKKSLIRDLELIFEKDSVVQDTVKLTYGNGAGNIFVYESGGPLLLTLTPNKDSIPAIQNVQINDGRYKTAEGMNINSTFKDVKENYEIRKIITSLNNILVLVKDSDIYFTIDKKELPENLRYNLNAKIEEVQIPDNAKLKYMMIGWD